jgi:hypothetical protein
MLIHHSNTRTARTSQSQGLLNSTGDDDDDDEDDDNDNDDDDEDDGYNDDWPHNKNQRNGKNSYIDGSSGPSRKRTGDGAGPSHSDLWIDDTGDLFRDWTRDTPSLCKPSERDLWLLGCILLEADLLLKIGPHVLEMCGDQRYQDTSSHITLLYRRLPYFKRRVVNDVRRGHLLLGFSGQGPNTVMPNTLELCKRYLQLCGLKRWSTTANMKTGLDVVFRFHYFHLAHQDAGRSRLLMCHDKLSHID